MDLLQSSNNQLNLGYYYTGYVRHNIILFENYYERIFTKEKPALSSRLLWEFSLLKTPGGKIFKTKFVMNQLIFEKHLYSPAKL